MTIPALSEWAAANSTVGIPASAPPIIGRKSTRATHSAHRNGNGTPVASSVTNTTTPAITEVRTLPSMYPVTDRLTSCAIREYRVARSGTIAPSSPSRIFGPSSSRSRTRMKMVNSSSSSESAPLPRLSAGLARPSPKLTSLGAFFCTHGRTWYLSTRCPSQPRPCSAAVTYVGSFWAR